MTVDFEKWYASTDHSDCKGNPYLAARKAWDAALLAERRELEAKGMKFKFYASDRGDMSVGIWPASYEVIIQISGLQNPEEDDIEFWRKAVAEYLDCSVETEEEMKRLVQAEQADLENEHPL